jgi:hypothetical protein
MADSEAKARQALEEAEKKSKKSGGFFGSLLGGGGSVGDACDLYNQVHSLEYPLESVKQCTSQAAEICCPVEGCSRILSNIVELEDHYQSIHSFQCGECFAKFLTSRALEVHIEEEHSPFFAAQLSLYSDRLLFECFSPACDSRFASKDARNTHCRQVHCLENDGRVVEDGRKSLFGIEKAVRDIQISNPPRFGVEQERMFDPKRKTLKAKRVLK